MNSSDQLIDISVAAEDVIRTLELLIEQSEAAIIRRPAREIPSQIFPISYALVRASQMASDTKRQLLSVLNMPDDTMLTARRADT